MRIVVRKRQQRATEEERVFTYDLCLLTENEEESKLLDLLGNTPLDEGEYDGLLAKGAFQVRLADGYGQHYVLLKGELEHVERFT